MPRHRRKRIAIEITVGIWGRLRKVEGGLFGPASTAQSRIVVQKLDFTLQMASVDQPLPSDWTERSRH